MEYAGFVPSDYSIWEESSSGLTGDPLPTSYFSFTQSMAFSGLMAGANLELCVYKNTTASQAFSDRADKVPSPQPAPCVWLRALGVERAGACTVAHQVRAAVEDKLWLEEGYYARAVWSTSLQVRTRRPPASLRACAFLCVCVMREADSVELLLIGPALHRLTPVTTRSRQRSCTPASPPTPAAGRSTWQPSTRT